MRVWVETRSSEGIMKDVGDVCSTDWPWRNWRADSENMRRMERLWCWERACRIRGILIVATEPVAARRRWCFLSVWWSEAFRIGCGGEGEGLGWFVDGAGGARRLFDCARK